jgi:hypothetical protein
MAQTVTNPEAGRALRAFRSFSVAGNPNSKLAVFTDFSGVIYDHSDKENGKLYVAIVTDDGPHSKTDARSFKSYEDAIKSLMIIVAGGVALKGPKSDGSGDYSFDLGEIKQNKNEADDEIILSEADTEALAKAAAGISLAMVDAKEGVIKTRVSNRVIGTFLNDARDLLSRTDDNGKYTPASNTAWGRWIVENGFVMFTGKSGKNVLGEYRAAARIPQAVIDAMPDDWASPKAILKHYGIAVKLLAGAAAERVLAKAGDDPEKSGAAAFKKARKAIDAAFVEYAEKGLAGQGEYVKAVAVVLAGDAEKLEAEFASAYSAALHNSDKTVQDNAAKAAAKTSATNTAVQRGFALFTFDEAVAHLVAIAASREDGVQVLDAAAAALDAKLSGEGEASEAEQDDDADAENDAA